MSNLDGVQVIKTVMPQKNQLMNMEVKCQVHFVCDCFSQSQYNATQLTVYTQMLWKYGKKMNLKSY